MTMDQQQWNETYNRAVDEKVAKLKADKEISGNTEILNQYRDQMAHEMFASGADPEEAADFAAKSLVRRPLIDNIRELTIKRRMCTNPEERKKLDSSIADAKAKYNSLMGMRCFESVSENRPLTEGVDLPNMICFGRGYGENSNPMDTSVIARFNSMAAMNDPYTGKMNPVLSMTQQFSAKNAGRFTADPNPELDKYVDTVFIGDMGPEAFTINGENPYRVLDKIKSGEEVDIPVPHGVSARPRMPDVTADTPSADPGYVETFSELFTPVN